MRDSPSLTSHFAFNAAKQPGLSMYSTGLSAHFFVTYNVIAYCPCEKKVKVAHVLITIKSYCCVR